VCAFVKRNCQWVLNSAPSKPNPRPDCATFRPYMVPYTPIAIPGTHATHHECRCINRSGPNQNPGKVITSLVMCTCHCGICLINKNADVPAPLALGFPLQPCGLWVLSGDPDCYPLSTFHAELSILGAKKALRLSVIVCLCNLCPDELYFRVRICPSVPLS